LLDTAADEITRVRRTGEAARLLLPVEMGEAFKVMALGRGLPQPRQRPSQLTSGVLT